MSRGARTGRVKAVRERRCAATGEVLGEAALLRVALSPDGQVVPDLAARLPGRGAWVKADRASVELAVRRKAFHRAFGEPVEVPEDLAGLFEAQLEARALSVLGLARRAGRLAMGYDAVRLALQKGPEPALRIEASDGAADGRGKLDALARAARPGLATVSCFSAEALGQALGKAGLVHAVLAQGPEAQALKAVTAKLAGFRPLDPAGHAAGAQNG
ncbi:MAG: RNA-binding protein [Oceanicaulis sp.]|nr:RNA-binding protein [Oceanicaulis sp.]